jgi:hypothetical protein
VTFCRFSTKRQVLVHDDHEAVSGGSRLGRSLLGGPDRTATLAEAVLQRKSRPAKLTQIGSRAQIATPAVQSRVPSVYL